MKEQYTKEEVMLILAVIASHSGASKKSTHFYFMKDDVLNSLKTMGNAQSALQTAKKELA